MQALTKSDVRKLVNTIAFGNPEERKEADATFNEFLDYTFSQEANPLQHMFNLQNKFQFNLGTWDKIQSPQDEQQFINQTILAIIEEATEIMRETPYKNPEFVKFGWKKGQKGNDELYAEEIVDLFHFLMNLCILKGITWLDFYKIYCKKNNINHKRQENNY